MLLPQITKSITGHRKKVDAYSTMGKHRQLNETWMTLLRNQECFLVFLFTQNGYTVCVFKAFKIVWKFTKVPIFVFVCRKHIIFRYGYCRRILQKKDQRKISIYRLLAKLLYSYCAKNCVLILHL